MDLILVWFAFVVGAALLNIAIEHATIGMNVFVLKAALPEVAIKDIF